MLQVFIEILNENDNVPMTERPVYYATVLEGSPSGTNVFQLVADDDDIDTNQKIHFKIVSGDPEGYFFVNSSTGELPELFTVFLIDLSLIFIRNGNRGNE